MRSAHDPDGRRLPVKLDSTSNGEYAPVRLTAAARDANRRAHAKADDAARRLGLPRRRYLVSLMGAAATLQAFESAFAAAGLNGGRYVLPREAPYELAAAQAAIGGNDDFVFDVQLHHVNPQGAWRQRGSWANVLRNFPNAGCGKADAIDCFSAETLLKDVFWDSDTSMGVLSHVPGATDDNPLDFITAAATRKAADALDGSQRLLLHGRVLPNLPGDVDGIDGMARQVESFPVAGFKTYTQFGPGGGFFLDDERHGQPFIERARALKVRNICVHKGLPFGQRGYEYSTCRDIGPAAKRFADMNFLVYHSGFDPRVPEGPYDANAKAGVDALIASVERASARGNVYAELGSTWRYLMREPEQAAHVLGKLLKHLGEDHILWGTDSVWYGSPQDQIQAFRAFEIGDAFRERFGYPALTPQAKRKILGLNAAKVYGIEPAKQAAKLRKDKVRKTKLEYLNAPDPAFATYGPRSRREFMAFRAMQPGP